MYIYIYYLNRLIACSHRVRTRAKGYAYKSWEGNRHEMQIQNA